MICDLQISTSMLW